MSKKFRAVYYWALAGLFALSACTAASTRVPTSVPQPIAPGLAQPSSTPALTGQPPTAAPATVAPTAAVFMAATDGPAPVTLTLWQAYTPGAAEEQALTALVAQYVRDHPGVRVNIQNIPGYRLYNRWQSEEAAGTAADLFTAPNDYLGDWVRAGAVAPLDVLLAGKLDGLSKVAIDAVTVSGHLYAVPGIVKVVALYYNKASIATPPATTSDLLSLVKSGKRMVLSENNYHNFGFFAAFGGQLMDASGKCTADQGGFAGAMQYLLDLKAAGAIFLADNAQAQAMFEAGAADMTIDGPWVLGDMEKAWGDQLGVASMPAGPQGPSRPLAGVDGFYINPRSPKAAAAADLALAIFSAKGLAQFAGAHDPPARVDVTIGDPLLQAFTSAAAGGIPRPQTKEFGNWWGPFGSMVIDVLDGSTTPADGVKTACDAMNRSNGK